MNMCKKWTVAYGDYIGKRLVSWCAYNGKDFSFLSDKQVGAKIRLGEVVNGLTLDAENNVVIDQEFTQNLLGKSGRTFSLIAHAEDDGDEMAMNKYYALVKVVKGKENADTEYHFITSRCGYEVFSEEQVKAMLEIFALGGVQLDSRGELVVHKAVDVADASWSQKEPPEGNKAKSGGEG